MFSSFGWTEAIIVLLIVMLLFGGKKLPELARGTGRALRIFKSETKGLMDDDDDDDDTKSSTGPSQAQITQSPVPPQPTQPGQPAKPAEPVQPPRTEG